MDVLGNDRFPNLQCLRAPPAGPPVASCFALRNKVPKSESRQVFGRDGRHGRPDEDPDEYVPYTLVGGTVMPVPYYLSNWTTDDRM